jgi:hypothetical protein
MFVNLIKIRPFGPFIITLKNRVSRLISDQGILTPGRHPISYPMILTARRLFGKPYNKKRKARLMAGLSLY